jgi:Na+/pantothenate symporter
MTRIMAYTLTVAVYVALAGFTLWLVVTRLSGKLTDKVAGLLQLIGAYSLVLGLLSALGVFKEFTWLQADLTSPDPQRDVDDPPVNAAAGPTSR